MSDCSSILVGYDQSKCRLCFDGEKGLIYIFEGSGTLKNVARTISEVLNYEVFQGDQFPPYICTECVDRLFDFMAFKVKCDSMKETYEWVLDAEEEGPSSTPVSNEASISVIRPNIRRIASVNREASTSVIRQNGQETVPISIEASTSVIRPNVIKTVSIISEVPPIPAKSSTKTHQAVKELRIKVMRKTVIVETPQLAQASRNVAREVQQETDKAVNGVIKEVSDGTKGPKNVLQVYQEKNQAVNEKEVEISNQIELSKSSKSRYTGLTVQIHPFANQMHPLANQIHPYANQLHPYLHQGSADSSGGTSVATNQHENDVAAEISWQTGHLQNLQGNADCEDVASVPIVQYENDFGAELSPLTGYQQNLQGSADCSGGTSVATNQHEYDVAAEISWQTGHQQNLQGNADCTVETSVPTDQYENDFGAEIFPLTGYQQNLQGNTDCAVRTSVPTDQYENDFGAEIYPLSVYQQNIQQSFYQGYADCTVGTSVPTDQYENDFGAELSPLTGYQQNLQIIVEDDDVSNQVQKCCRVSVLKEVTAISTSAADHNGSKNSRKRKLVDREENAAIGAQVYEDSCSIEDGVAADNNVADCCVEEAVPSTSQDDGPKCKRRKLTIGDGTVETQVYEDFCSIEDDNPAENNNADACFEEAVTSISQDDSPKSRKRKLMTGGGSFETQVCEDVYSIAEGNAAENNSADACFEEAVPCIRQDDIPKSRKRKLATGGRSIETQVSEDFCSEDEGPKCKRRKLMIGDGTVETQRITNVEDITSANANHAKDSNAILAQDDSEESQDCEDFGSKEEDNAADNNVADCCVEEAVPSTSQDDGPKCKRRKLTIGDGTVETQGKDDSEDITPAHANPSKDYRAAPEQDYSEDSQDEERGTEEEEDSPVECDRCLERFWMKYSQKKHLRVHVIKRPYQCDVCWKRFSKEHILTAHRLLHLKEKPKHNHHPNYPCPWEPLYTFIKSHFKARYQAIGGSNAGQSPLGDDRTEESTEIPSVSGENNGNNVVEAALPVTASQESSAVKQRRIWRKRIGDTSIAQESLPIKKRRRWRWKNGIAEKRKRSPESTAQDCSRNCNTQAATTSNAVNVIPEVKMQLRKRRRRYNFHRGKWELIPNDHGRYLRPRKKTNYRLDYSDSDCESIKSIGIPNQVPDSSPGGSSTKKVRPRKKTSSGRGGNTAHQGLTENGSRLEGETSKSLVRPRPLKKLTSVQRAALRFYKRNRKIKASRVATKSVNTETDEAILPSDAKVGSLYDCIPCTVSVQRLNCPGSSYEYRNDMGDQAVSTAATAEDNSALAVSIDQEGCKGTDENPGINPVSSVAAAEDDTSSISKEPEDPHRSSEANDDVNSTASSPIPSGFKEVSCTSSDSISESSLDSTQTLDGHRRAEDSNHPMKVIPLKASNDGEFRFLFKKVPKKHKLEDDLNNSKEAMPGSIQQCISSKLICRRDGQPISAEHNWEENAAQSSDGIVGVIGATCSVEGNLPRNAVLDEKKSAGTTCTKVTFSVPNKNRVIVGGKSKEVTARNTKKDHILAASKEKSNKETSENSCTILVKLSKVPSGTSETFLNPEDDVESSTDDSNKGKELKVSYTESQDEKVGRMSSVQKLKGGCNKAVVFGVEMERDISTDSQQSAGEVENSFPASSQKLITEGEPQGGSSRISKENSNTSKKNVGISGNKSSKGDTSKKNRETLGSISNKAAGSEARKEQVFGGESRESRLDKYKDNKQGSSKKSMSQRHHKGGSRETSQSNCKASEHKSGNGIQKEGGKKKGFSKEHRKRSKRDPPRLSPATSINTSTNNCTDGKGKSTSNPPTLKNFNYQEDPTSSLGPSRISSHSRKYFDDKSHKEATISRVPSLTAPETYLPRKDKSRRCVSASPSSSSRSSSFSSCSKSESVSKQSEQSNKSEKSIIISSKVDNKEKTARVRSLSHHSYDKNKNESTGTNTVRSPSLEPSKSHKIARRRSTSANRTVKDSSAHHSKGESKSERAERSVPDSEKTTKSHKGDKKNHDSSMQTTSGTSNSQLGGKASSRDDKSIDLKSAEERSKIQTEAKSRCASVSHTADGKRIKEGHNSDSVAERHRKSQDRDRKSSTSSMATMQTSESRSQDKIISKGTKRIHSISKCIALAKHAKIEKHGHSSTVKNTFAGSGHHSLDKNKSQSAERTHSKPSASKDKKSQKDDKKRHASVEASNPPSKKHHSNDIPTQNEERRSTTSNPVAGEMVKLQKTSKESSPAKRKRNNSSSHFSNDNRCNERCVSDDTVVKKAKSHNKSMKVDAPAAAKKSSTPGLTSDDKISKKGLESTSLNRSEVKASKTSKDKEKTKSLVIEAASSSDVGPSKDKVSSETPNKSDVTQAAVAISQNTVGLKSNRSTSLPSTSSRKSHSNDGVHKKGSKTSKLTTSSKETTVLRKDTFEISDVTATASSEIITCSASNSDLKSISNVSRQNSIPPKADFAKHNSKPLASANDSNVSNNSTPLLSFSTVVLSTVAKSRGKTDVQINREDSQKSNVNPTAVKAPILQEDAIGNNVSSSGSASKCFDSKSSSLDSKHSAAATKPSVSCRPVVEIGEEGSQKCDLNSAAAKSTVVQKDTSGTDINSLGSLSNRDSCDTSNPPSKQTETSALVQIGGMPSRNAFNTLLLIASSRYAIPEVVPSTSETVAESSPSTKSSSESKCMNEKEDAGGKDMNLTQVEAHESEESIHVLAEQIPSSCISNTEGESSKHCSKSNVLDLKALERSVSEEDQTNQPIPEPTTSRNFSCNSNDTASNERSDQCALDSAVRKTANSSEGVPAKPFVSSAIALVNPRLSNSDESLKSIANNSEKKSFTQSQELQKTTSGNESCFSREECSNETAKSSDFDPTAIDTSTSNKNSVTSFTAVSPRLSQNSGMIKDQEDKSDTTVVDASLEGESEKCFNSSTRTERNSYCSSSSENQKSYPGLFEESQSSASIKSPTISLPSSITSADHSERSGSQDLHNTHAVSDASGVKYLCTKCHSVTSSESKTSNSTPEEGTTSQTDSGGSSGIAHGNHFNNSANPPKSSIYACNVSGKSSEGKSQEMQVQNPSKSNTSEHCRSSEPNQNLRTHPPPRKPKFKYLSTNCDYLTGYTSAGSSSSNPTPEKTSNSQTNAVASTEVMPNRVSHQSIDEINDEAPQRKIVAARRPELQSGLCSRPSQSVSMNYGDSPGSTSIMSTTENLEWKLIPITINPISRNISKPTAAEIHSRAFSSKMDCVDAASTSTSISSNSDNDIRNEDSKNRFMNTLSLRRTGMQGSVPETNRSAPQCSPRKPNLKPSSTGSRSPMESPRICTILEKLEIVKSGYLEALYGSEDISSEQRGEETASTQRDTSGTSLNASQVLSISRGSVSSADGSESTLEQTEQTQSAHSGQLILQTPSITITRVAPSDIFRSKVNPCRTCTVTSRSVRKSFFGHPNNMNNNGRYESTAVNLRTSSIHRDVNRSLNTTLPTTLINIRPTPEDLVNKEDSGRHSFNFRDREASLSGTEVDNYRHDPLLRDSSQSSTCSIVRSSSVSSEGNHSAHTNDSLVIYACNSASSAGCSTTSVPSTEPHPSCTMAGTIPSRDPRNVARYSFSVQAPRTHCLESKNILPAASHSAMQNASSYLPHNFGDNHSNITSQSGHFGTTNPRMISSQRYPFCVSCAASSYSNNRNNERFAFMYPERRRVEWGRSELLMNATNPTVSTRREIYDQRQAFTNALSRIYSYHSNYQFREVSMSSSSDHTAVTAAMYQKDEVASTSGIVSSKADSGESTSDARGTVSNPVGSKSRCEKDTVRSGVSVQSSSALNEGGFNNDPLNPALEIMPVQQTLSSERFGNNPPITSTNCSGILSVISSDQSDVNSSAETASIPQTVSSGMFVNNQPSTSTYSSNSSCIVGLKLIDEKSKQSQAPSKEVSVQHPSISSHSGVQPKMCTSQGNSCSSVPQPSTSKCLSNSCDYLTNNGLAQCSSVKTVTDPLDSGEAGESKSTEGTNESVPNGNSSEKVTGNQKKNQAPSEKSQNTSMPSDSSSKRSTRPMWSHESGSGSECDSNDSNKNLFPPGTSPVASTSRKPESRKCGNNAKASPSGLNRQDSDMSISDDSGSNLDISGSCSTSMQSDSNRSCDNSFKSVSNGSEGNPIRPIITSTAYRSRNTVHYSGYNDSAPMSNNLYWNPSLPTRRFYPLHPYRPYTRPCSYQRYPGNYRSPRTFPPFMCGNSSHFPGGQTSVNSSYSNQFRSNNTRVVSHVQASVSHRRDFYGPTNVGNTSSRSSYHVPPYCERSTDYGVENTEYSEETFTVVSNNMDWDHRDEY